MPMNQQQDKQDNEQDVLPLVGAFARMSEPRGRAWADIASDTDDLGVPPELVNNGETASGSDFKPHANSQGFSHHDDHRGKDPPVFETPIFTQDLQSSS